MSDDDLNRFSDVQTAMIWFFGLRALAGTEDPTCVCTLRYKRIEYGPAVLLNMESEPGVRWRCVAELPEPLPERLPNKQDLFEWLAGVNSNAERLRYSAVAGSA